MVRGNDRRVVVLGAPVPRKSSGAREQTNAKERWAHQSHGCRWLPTLSLRELRKKEAAVLAVQLSENCCSSSKGRLTPISPSLLSHVSIHKSCVGKTPPLIEEPKLQQWMGLRLPKPRGTPDETGLHLPLLLSCKQTFLYELDVRAKFWDGASNEHFFNQLDVRAKFFFCFEGRGRMSQALRWCVQWTFFPFHKKTHGSSIAFWLGSKTNPMWVVLELFSFLFYGDRDLNLFFFNPSRIPWPHHCPTDVFVQPNLIRIALLGQKTRDRHVVCILRPYFKFREQG